MGDDDVIMTGYQWEMMRLGLVINDEVRTDGPN